MLKPDLFCFNQKLTTKIRPGLYLSAVNKISNFRIKRILRIILKSWLYWIRVLSNTWSKQKHFWLSWILDRTAPTSAAGCNKNVATGQNAIFQLNRIFGNLQQKCCNCSRGVKLPLNHFLIVRSSKFQSKKWFLQETWHKADGGTLIARRNSRN